MTKKQLQGRIAACIVGQTLYDPTGNRDAAAIVSMPEMARLVGTCSRVAIENPRGIYTARYKTSCGVVIGPRCWSDKYCRYCGKEIDGRR